MPLSQVSLTCGPQGGGGQEVSGGGAGSRSSRQRRLSAQAPVWGRRGVRARPLGTSIPKRGAWGGVLSPPLPWARGGRAVAGSLLRNRNQALVSSAADERWLPELRPLTRLSRCRGSASSSPGPDLISGPNEEKSCFSKGRCGVWVVEELSQGQGGNEGARRRTPHPFPIPGGFCPVLDSVMPVQERASKQDLFTRKRKKKYINNLKKEKASPPQGRALPLPPSAAMCSCWNILRGGETSGSWAFFRPPLPPLWLIETLPGKERFGPEEALPFRSKQRTVCAAG